MTGQLTGQAGAQAGQTGSLAGQTTVVGAAVSPAPVVPSAAVGDFSATISARLRAIGWKEDIYRDYIHFLTGSSFDAVTWRLASSATSVEFQIWESHIDGGFERCKALDSTFGGQIEFDLAYRRVDNELAKW